MKDINFRDFTDFPFENVSNKRWIISMILIFAGFFILMFSTVYLSMIFKSKQLIFIASIVLMLIISYIPLKILDKNFFKKIFKKVRIHDIFVIILSIVMSVILAFAASQGTDKLAENPITDIVNPDNILLISISSAVQLIFEEVIFVIPFLFIYNKAKFKMNKKLAVLIAWVLSSVIFGALHLSTYNFNLYQCLVVIGAVRMGMSLGYLITKNLTVSYLSHYLSL